MEIDLVEILGMASTSLMRASWNINPARNPRALAGRLRRAQTFLRIPDTEILFGREGRSGARIIRLNALGQSRSTANRMDWGRGVERPVSREWDTMSTVTS